MSEKGKEPLKKEVRVVGSNSSVMSELKQFRLINDQGKVGGVCAGIAYRFCVPVWTVRLLLVASVCMLGIGILPYILLWIFVPDAKGTPSDYNERTGGS